MQELCGGVDYMQNCDIIVSELELLNSIFELIPPGE